MPKLYFYFGTTGGGKTANLLMSNYEYKSANKATLLIKPQDDTRSEYIMSRVGIKAVPNIIVPPNDLSCLEALIANDFEFIKSKNIKAAFVDEVQFLSCDAIPLLKKLSTAIPVMCYGLRTTWQLKLFPTAAVLMAYADVIQEVKSMCHAQDCNHKAFMSVKIQNGNPVDPNVEGDVIDLGFDKYKPMCYEHAFSGFN